MSFSATATRLLSDGSPGSGVNPSSLSSPQTFNTDGSHEASGTVADNVGNVSAPGTLTVQVDATAPSVEVELPRQSGASAAATSASVDGIRRPVGTRPQTRAARADRHEQSRGNDVERHGDRQRRPRNDRVVHDRRRTRILGRAVRLGREQPEQHGLFTLAWTGADPLTYFGVSYTLEHHNAATAEWSTVATEIEALEYDIHWQPARLKGRGSTGSRDTTRRKQRIDRMVAAPPHRSRSTRPPRTPPSASADRAPDYAGGGGWYKDTVKCPSRTTATRCCRTAAPAAASTWRRCPHRRRSTPTARTKRAARSPTTSATSRPPGTLTRAGRRLGADRRSQLPGAGVDRRQRRQCDGDGL